MTTSQRLVLLTRFQEWLEKRTGKRLHRSAGYRWRQRGIGGVKLPTIRVGGNLYTSVEAVEWWCAAIEGHADATAAAVRASVADATADDETLRRAGVL